MGNPLGALLSKLVGGLLGRLQANLPGKADNRLTDAVIYCSGSATNNQHSCNDKPLAGMSINITVKISRWP